MRTRKPTEAEKAQYDALQDNSANWKRTCELSAKFYANGATWEGIDDLVPEFREVTLAWKQERYDAGFVMSQAGLRVIVQR